MTEHDEEFKKWMEEVDRYISRNVGVSADDLPDYCYRDAFEAGDSPKQAARDAIKAARD